MNKNKWRASVLAAVLTLALLLTACGTSAPVGDTSDTTAESETGTIYLYGEAHSVEALLERELELWQSYYHEQNMRHLFIEYPYYTAEFLNLYMQAEGEEILDAIYEDWPGTQSYIPVVKDFYRQIKEKCPETIFHGTDVGHQYKTTGARFLAYLEENGLQETEQYTLTQQAIEQGRTYYETRDDAYRENKMVENFIRTVDSLPGENIMGIYGAAHTALNAKAYQCNDTYSMATQLYEHYSDVMIIENLIEYMQEAAVPQRMDTIEVNGKSYQAAYYGRRELANEYLYQDFWRLEDAYPDFKSNRKTGDALACENYPMKVETKQVFVVDLAMADGKILRKYYRADGTNWQGSPATVEVLPR